MTGERKRRVLFVINDLSRAGAESQLVDLALALDPARYDVAIVLLKHRNQFAAELAERGIPVTALHRRGFWDVGLPFRLFRAIRDFRPDIVHGSLFLANLMAALAARAAGAPALVLSQRCSYEATLNPPSRRLARWSHRRADRVIVNSHAAWREEIAAGFPPDRMVVVPNGVRCSVERADRARLGLADGPLVVAVGTLDPVKGHRYLLDAWPRVRRHVPDAHLVLVGDGPLRDELPRQAASLGLGDSVRFAGFHSPASPFVAACDVFVLPSVTEGMPNALLEAMCLGRAVVATRVGGVPELVVEGESGLLTPPRDSAALAAAIGGLLADGPRRDALGQAAAVRARERFTIEAMTAATVAVYDQILRAERGRLPSG